MAGQNNRAINPFDIPVSDSSGQPLEKLEHIVVIDPPPIHMLRDKLAQIQATEINK